MTRLPKLANNSLPWNVVFHEGAVGQLSGELHKLGYSRALIVSTPSRKSAIAEIARQITDRTAAHFDQATQHVPMNVVIAAMAAARNCNADCVISVGGGSTTGLGKALALKMRLPNIAIPTSYAGSEMTDIWGISEDGDKVTGRDIVVLPELVVYDPLLTLQLPISISASSGMNAIAQAAVNIMEQDADPQVTAMALQAVSLLAGSLPNIVLAPDDVAARSDALHGACLAGAALGAGVTSLHHRLCHIIGGRFNTNHADTHAVLLPHTVAYNAPAVPDETAALAEVLDTMNAGTGLHELATQIGAPLSLASLGLMQDDLDTIVDIATEAPMRNPRQVEKTGLKTLLQNAYDGVPPQ